MKKLDLGIKRHIDFLIGRYPESWKIGSSGRKMANEWRFADSFVPKTRMVLFFFMIGISIIASVHYLKKSSMKFLAFEMLLLVISWINGYNSVLVKGYKWDDALALLRVYIYPIVAIAVIPLLTSGIWRFEKLLKFLAVATCIETVSIE